MERVKRAVCLLLCLVMVVGMLPMSAFAATADDSLTAALTEAKDYIDALTVNNSANDPKTVVSKFGTHFTWDNEKRESNSKVSYLYDWSYYNGVVFEGLQYLYEVTGKEIYKNYVIEYLSAMIDANGNWAVCTNNEEKTAAGYVDYHGADCYKTASLLLDAYDLTRDDRYLTMAKELYLDLNENDNDHVVLLDEAGYNYRHTWSSDPDLDLWLDGLYMILPFRAEYAKYIDDQEELDLIVDRLSWVSENMYNDDNGLFYHAANSDDENSGTYWLRSIGWYAAAIADVMDSVSEADRAVLAKQLVKLADGLWDRQGINGMWLNNLAAAESDSNPYETSGTALVCYAVLKAVNNGWIEEAYADMAIKGFVGICENKLEDNNLTDICFKGVPGGSNSTYYDNEGKGVGPFIMLTAEVQEYVNNLPAEPEETEPTEPELTDIRVAYTRETLLGEELKLNVYALYSDGTEVLLSEDQYTVEGYNPNTTGTQGIVVTYGNFSRGFNVVTLDGGVTVVGDDGLSGLTATDVTADETVVSAMAAVETNGFVAYDFTSNTNAAVVSIPVPAEWAEGKLVAYYIDENGKIAETIPAEYANGKAVFEVSHFSTYAVSNEPVVAAETGSKSDTGNLVGGKVYTLDTDGVFANKNYLIVSGNSGNVSALTNNNGTAGRTAVTISGSGTNRTISVEDDSNIAWQFSGTTSGSVGNNDRYYVYPNNGSLSLNTTGSNLTISSQGSGEYRIYRTDTSNRKYYLRYNDGWTGTRVNSYSSTAYSVYLYELTSSSSGEAVTFTVNPGSVTVAPKGTKALTGTVTVGGEEVALSNCTITWTSADASKATVTNGTVTGVADGTTNITATLSAVNGTALQDDIVLTIPVTVASKPIDHYELTGNTPINVSLNETPDFSGIKYVAVYEDNSTAELPLTFGACDTSTSGKKPVDILYNGIKVGEVIVNVTVDFSKLPVADMDQAPEYPNDGAVRIDKTATHNAEEFNRTGVTRVELDVAGISVESAVDVIMIMDISNSMSWDDSTYDYADKTVSSGTNQRLNIARASAKEFVRELMKDNGDDDTSTVDNTLTLLAFAGIDGDYNDHSTAAANDDVYQLGALAMDNIDDANAALDQLVKATTGGTNYDYAFQQAYALAERLHSERGNRVYIVFMTDGVPTHYNGVYYKSRSNTDLTAMMNYIDPVTGAESRYTSTGNDRNGNDIDSTATKSITVYYNDGTTGTKNVTYNKGWSDYVTGNKNGWAEKVKALDYVAHVYAIGFGMKNGSVTQGATTSMPTLNNVNGGTYYIPSDVTHATLSHIATDAASHFEADNEEELSKLYASLATQIKFAGTEAVVKDMVDQDFSVQMLPYVLDNNGNQIALKTLPSITIRTYDLYPRGTVIDEVDVTGKRTGTSQEIETVTFAVVDGKLEAYSNVIGAGVNILTIDAVGNMVINAKNFTYTKNAATSEEHFEWSIGNITDKEIALAYDAYLEGSMTGECPEDIYFTNEEATLEYVDIYGYYAKKVFPIPGVAWGGATTTIRFYLVNENGEPVNRNGVVIPWENRVYVGEPVTVALNLNADLTIDAQKIEAAAHVPAQFFLYDQNAFYTVQTSSSEDAITGSITPSDPSADAYKTTGTAPNAVTQTGAQTTRVIAAEDKYYTWSYVGFGVRWDLTAEPTEYVLASDQVVIDYGKSILVDVLNNDPDRPGYTRELVGFIKYTAGTDLSYVMQNPGSATWTADHGNFSISNGEVQFQPTKIVNDVQRVFYAVRYTETNNTQNSYIVWGQLDVIPATIVYYETDFADGVFTEEGTWTTKTKGNAADGPQDDGTIGKNQTYGYDFSYENDDFLSNGSSKFVLGEIDGNGKYLTTTSFSFTGTGFDLISRTGKDQGLIKVQVATDSAMNNIVKTVSVLNKSESNLELYQIPVVSINDLPHKTYYVKISVDTFFVNDTGIDALDALERGNEFYFDAIRIYDPAQGNTIAEAAYNADGEANNILDEVRQLLISAATFDAIPSGSTTSGMVYVDSTYTDGNADHETGNVNVTDYAKIGPNNEVYLSKGQAVAFKVSATEKPASFDIGAKSITGSTAGLMVTVRNDDGSKSWTVTKEIKSSTVQYIDLLTTDSDASILFGEGAYVVITNTADGVLSITDLKTAFRVEEASKASEIKGTLQKLPNISVMSTEAEAEALEPFAVSYTVDAGTLEVARAVLTASDDEVVEPEEPVIPDEPEIDPSCNILNASVKVNGSKKNQRYTITVITSRNVEDITVMHEGKELSVSKISYKDSKKSDTRQWTIVVTGKGLIPYDSFTLTGFGPDGSHGEAFEISISNDEGRIKK